MAHPDTEPAPHTPAAPMLARRLALVGRPNSGKSSLFNRLTGGSAHVGNFPGITVDILEGAAPWPTGGTATVVDLPGVYSLRAAIDPASDEGVARTFLDEATAGDPEGTRLVMVQVIDGTQLALGLRLTRELLTRTEPLLVVVSQLDLVQADGHELDAARLEAALGVPVVAVSARDPQSRDIVMRAVESLDRTVALGDRSIDAWDPDRLAREVCVDRAGENARIAARRQRSARADAVLLHPVLGPLLFVVVMAALFAAVFLVADPVSSACDAGVQWAGVRLTRLFGDGLLASFLADGALGGAGTVLAFLPQILILTIAMELLEATGYLARGAFLVDRALRGVGLGGRAFVPLLTAHACAIPAIAATRIMRDPRERLSTILVLPLMTCSARIPTYSLLISTFFSGRSVWFKSGLFVGLYFAGVFSGLVASAWIQRTATRGRRLPLVLEMPAYRTPQWRAVWQVTARAGSRFVREVGTTILIVSLVLWALLTVPLPGMHAQPLPTGTPARVVRMQHSVAAGLGHALEPVTRPLGFDWRINVGLIGSFGARELMVSTLGVIFGIEQTGNDTSPLSHRVRDARRADGTLAYSPLTALSLMAFFVLACQCMSTVAAIRRETRSWRWAAFVLGYTYVAAYAASLLVFQGGRALGFT